MIAWKTVGLLALAGALLMSCASHAPSLRPRNPVLSIEVCLPSAKERGFNDRERDELLDGVSDCIKLGYGTATAGAVVHFDGEVRLGATLDAKGRLQRVEFTQPSSDRAVNAMVTDWLQGCSPFGHLPKGVPQADLSISLEQEPSE